MSFVVTVGNNINLGAETVQTVEFIAATDLTVTVL